MIVGKDYVYVKKNLSGIVTMFLDEECTNYYVNSCIYDKACEFALQLENGQVEVFYL